MKTGIIGLPQVGKTSLFKILTKARLEAGVYLNPKEAHVGVAKVPDERLDKLAALYHPKKTIHAAVEYVDVAAIGKEALKETAFTASVRGFMFLSEKPILYVLNISESSELGRDLEEAGKKFKVEEVASRPHAGVTAICGKVEAELAEMPDSEAAEFLASYGLKESGLAR